MLQKWQVLRIFGRFFLNLFLDHFEPNFKNTDQLHWGRYTDPSDNPAPHLYPALTPHHLHPSPEKLPGLPGQHSCIAVWVQVQVQVQVELYRGQRVTPARDRE